MQFDTQTPKKFTPTPNPPKILVIYRFRLLITAKQCFTSHKIINIYKFYKDSSCSHVFLKFWHFLSVLINVIVKPVWLTCSIWNIQQFRHVWIYSVHLTNQKYQETYKLIPQEMEQVQNYCTSFNRVIHWKGKISNLCKQ